MTGTKQSRRGNFVLAGAALLAAVLFLAPTTAQAGSNITVGGGGFYLYGPNGGLGINYQERNYGGGYYPQRPYVARRPVYRPRPVYRGYGYGGGCRPRHHHHRHHGYGYGR